MLTASGLNPTLPSDINKKRKTAWIAGCAGFLGSHFVNRLLKEGFRVVGIDNLLTGSKENLTEAFKDLNFDFRQFDICQEFDTWPKPDYIVNFASPASPKHYALYPIETLMVGSIGAFNLLDVAKDFKARIVNISTSEVYGDALVHPQHEGYYGNVNSVGDRSMYDESKRFMEAATTWYRKIYGVNTGIARLFNSYGENMQVDDGRAIPNFMSQAIRGEDITIYGNGQQTRSFTYWKDTTDGIYKLMLSDYHDPVNIGSTEEISLNQLAKEIIEITGTKSRVVYKPLPSDDPKQRKPDITLAKKVLGWQPVFDRAEGLKRTYEYFKKILLPDAVNNS